VDIFTAPQTSREVALFYVHGGGWRGGRRTIFHSNNHEYCRRGFDCASTDYRLCGANVFEQVGVVRTGLDIFIGDWVVRHRPPRVLPIGSSAGAHLALLAALARPEECGAPETPLLHECEIAGIAVQAAPFTFEPWPDIFPGSREALQVAVGAPYNGNEGLYQRASPMNYIRSGNPPLFALHAENEHMFPLEIAAEFAKRSTASGNVVQEKIYPRTEHGFFYSLERRQQCEAFEDIEQFAESVAIRS
jgi:acetyl esterase/lipase